MGLNVLKLDYLVTPGAVSLKQLNAATKDTSVGQTWRRCQEESCRFLSSAWGRRVCSSAPLTPGNGPAYTLAFVPLLIYISLHGHVSLPHDAARSARPAKPFRPDSNRRFSPSWCIRMDAKEEALSLLSKMWLKLQNLPSASSLDLAAFFIILTFMGEFGSGL